jgi:hypothetical protein
MFISYQYIFDNFKNGDVFYDKELQRFEFVEKKQYANSLKEIKIIDHEGSDASIYNYTKLSRILLSMGYSGNLKKSIFWDKNILLTEDFADSLLDEQHENIIIEYKNMLEMGVKNGLISKKEYKELIDNII